MRLNKEFVLRQVADTWVLLAIGATSVDFNGMLTLNESGVMLWKALEEGADREELIELLMREYAVSRDVATSDVDEYLGKLAKEGCIQE